MTKGVGSGAEKSYYHDNRKSSCHLYFGVFNFDVVRSSWSNLDWMPFILNFHYVSKI